MLLWILETVLTVLSTCLGTLDTAGWHFPVAGVVVENASVPTISSQFDDRFMLPHAGYIPRADCCRFVHKHASILASLLLRYAVVSDLRFSHLDPDGPGCFKVRVDQLTTHQARCFVEMV